MGRGRGKDPRSILLTGRGAVSRRNPLENVYWGKRSASELMLLLDDPELFWQEVLSEEEAVKNFREASSQDTIANPFYKAFAKRRGEVFMNKIQNLERTHLKPGASRFSEQHNPRNLNRAFHGEFSRSLLNRGTVPSFETTISRSKACDEAFTKAFLHPDAPDIDFVIEEVLPKIDSTFSDIPQGINNYVNQKVVGAAFVHDWVLSHVEPGKRPAWNQSQINPWVKREKDLGGDVVRKMQRKSLETDRPLKAEDLYEELYFVRNENMTLELIFLASKTIEDPRRDISSIRRVENELKEYNPKEFLYQYTTYLDKNNPDSPQILQEFEDTMKRGDIYDLGAKELHGILQSAALSITKDLTEDPNKSTCFLSYITSALNE